MAQKRFRTAGQIVGRTIGQTVRWICVAFLVTAPAYSEDVTVLDPIVVTARGAACPVSRTPGGTGVMDGETIHETVPMGVADAVDRIPGADRIMDSPWGSDIAIRGLSRNRVTVLIDGCRVNTATDINGRLGLIRPEDIERIEILKGPVSEIYGAGSIGGVVNIITRKGEFSAVPELKSTLSGTWGNNPSGAGVGGSVIYNAPRQWSRVSAGYRDFDSFEAGNGETTANSQYRDVSGMMETARRWNPENETAFQIQALEGRNVGIPGKGAALPAGPDVTYPRTGRFLAQLTHTLSPKAPFLEASKLILYYQKIQRRVIIDHFPEGAVKAVAPGADHHTWGVKWINTAASGPHTLAGGIDFWRWMIRNTERVKSFTNGLIGSDSSLGNVRQWSAGIFVEDDWRISDRLTLNLGARADEIGARCDDLYDWIAPPSSNITPMLKREGGDATDLGWSAHLGATWVISPVWSMTFLASSGYRPPDIMERFKYISLGGGVSLYGNPDLEPERSLFFECGLHAVTPSLRFSAGLYADFLENLITERILSPDTIEMTNADEARITGGELDMEWYFHPRLSLYGCLSYVYGKNTSTDEYLPSIPPLNGLLGFRYDTGRGLWASIETQWAADQHQTPPEIESGDAWAVLNFRAGWRFHAAGIDHDAVIGVSNLLDKDYTNCLSTSRGTVLKEPGVGVLAAWRLFF